MKKLLSIILAAGLLLHPFAAYAADYGSQTSQRNEVLPVAQTLVREGDFAVKLAATLDLGQPTTEAEAMDMLAKAGVAPLNGWIPDYPMTPQIVGQLQTAITKAAAEGNLPMTAEEATKGLHYLTTEMNLPTPAGPVAPEKESSQLPAEKSDQAVINNYYYDQGPPIITYYPPPVYFAFLYYWVPYPSWWFGFWFPGFYICHDFTTVVVSRTAFVTRTAIVSNQIIEPVTRRVAVVHPVVRTGAGAVRPVTTLRTESGRVVRNLTELRSVSGLNTGTPSTSADGSIRTEGFRSPEARKSAETIYRRSLGGISTSRGSDGSTARGNARRFVAPSSRGSSFSGTVQGEQRKYVAPSTPERSYRPPAMRRGNESVRPFTTQPRASERSFNAPSRGGERPFIAPGSSAIPFSGAGSAVRGGDRDAPRSFRGYGRR